MAYRGSMTAYRGDTMAYLEIPSDGEVISALRVLGGCATASDLCDRLVTEGHPRRDSQLAIQRTLERGNLSLASDLKLQLVEQTAASAA